MNEIWVELRSLALAWLPITLEVAGILIAGWLVALLLRRLCRVLFGRERLRRASSRLGLETLKERLGIEADIAQTTSTVVFYLTLLLFLQAAIDHSGLRVLSSAVDGFFRQIPRFLAAGLIVLAGFVGARFVRSFIEKTAKGFGIAAARALGQLVGAGFVFAAIVMAASKLGLDTTLINFVAGTLFAGIVVSGVVMFGVGSIDSARNILAGFYLRKNLTPGDEITFSGTSGVLIAVNTVQTSIRIGNDVRMVENRMLIADVAVADPITGDYDQNT